MFIEVLDRSNTVNFINKNHIESIRTMKNNSTGNTEIHLTSGSVIFTNETSDIILAKLAVII